MRRLLPCWQSATSSKQKTRQKTRQDIFSSISTYIWGQDDQGKSKEVTTSHPPSCEVTDWILFGDFKHRADETMEETNKEAPCEQYHTHIPKNHKDLKRNLCIPWCLGEEQTCKAEIEHQDGLDEQEYEAVLIHKCVMESTVHCSHNHIPIKYGWQAGAELCQPKAECWAYF